MKRRQRNWPALRNACRTPEGRAKINAALELAQQKKAESEGHLRAARAELEGVSELPDGEDKDRLRAHAQQLIDRASEHVDNWEADVQGLERCLREARTLLV